MRPHIRIDQYPVRFANGDAEQLDSRHLQTTLFESAGLESMIENADLKLRIVSRYDDETGQVTVELATFQMDGSSEPVETEVLLCRPLTTRRPETGDFGIIPRYPTEPTGPGAAEAKRKLRKSS